MGRQATLLGVVISVFLWMLTIGDWSQSTEALYMAVIAAVAIECFPKKGGHE